jgi:hypothetical protein
MTPLEKSGVMTGSQAGNPGCPIKRTDASIAIIVVQRYP